MKNKPTIIEIPILNDEYWVYVIWGDGCLKYLTKHFDDAYIEKEEVTGYRGRCHWRKEYNPVIHMIIEPNDKHFWGTLSHESCHAVYFIWNYIGETSFWEVYAHSVGAIVHGVEKHLNKHLIKKYKE